MNKSFLTISKVILLSTLFTDLISCKNQDNKAPTFQGDENAVSLAEQMFEAIGGKNNWCNLKSLYIKAEHTEPQMTIPYQSEIWRGIDKFELIIEQQNDSFHVKGVIDEQGGTIRYYDKRDTFRLLSDQQLKDWKFDHNHNVYVILHNLGCNPQDYRVELDEERKLSFYQDSVFYTSFGLDNKMRPYMFYKPNTDGTISVSRFTHWGTDEGLVHSAGGHPLDSSFMYRTEIWQPSESSLNETFGEKIFEID